MGAKSRLIALTTRAGGNVGLDRLSERERDLRALLRRAEKKLVVSIAHIACLEQHTRSRGPAEHMESGEAVRVGTKLEPPCRLVNEARCEVGGSAHLRLHRQV